MNQPSSAPLLQQLTDHLDQIEHCLAQEDADTALRVLAEHDATLHTVFASLPDALDTEALAALNERQVLVLGKMQQARDAAAERLRNQRTTRTAVSAYQNSGKYGR